MLATLDIGTSSVKAALWDCREERVYQARSDIPFPSFSDGCVEQDLGAILRSVCECLRQLKIISPASTWTALGITSQRGTFLALDDKHQPLTPLFSWLDHRAEHLKQGRWEWLQRNDSPVASQTRFLGSVMSWILFLLTNQWVDSVQTCPVEYEALTKTPGSPALAPIANIGATYPARGTLANHLELPAELPIVICGGDKNCEMVGARLLRKQASSLSFGTAISLACWMPANSATPKAYVSPTHDKDFLQVEIGIPFGGAIWAWLKKLFPHGQECLPDFPNTTLGFVPHLAGSLWDRTARGAWLNINPQHGPLDFQMSAMAAVVCELMVLGIHIVSHKAPIVFSGGGGQNLVLAQWFCDALGSRIILPQIEYTGLLGAASLSDPSSSFAYACGFKKELQPRQEHHFRWKQLAQNHAQRVAARRDGI